jgi:protein-tyrosine phosphatase
MATGQSWASGSSGLRDTPIVSLTVLFVCTGNICRSPLAERLFVARSAPESAVFAHSAGVYALEGYPMDQASALALRELGGDGSGHLAQYLNESLIEEADLILGAEEAHRDTVLRLAPSSMRRAFTMREFARLGADVAPAADVGQAKAVIASVAARRGLVDAVTPGTDDIADPYRRPMDDVRECAQQIAHAVDATLRLLGVGQRSTLPG